MLSAAFLVFSLWHYFAIPYILLILLKLQRVESCFRLDIVVVYLLVNLCLLVFANLYQLFFS